MKRRYFIPLLVLSLFLGLILTQETAFAYFKDEQLIDTYESGNATQNFYQLINPSTQWEAATTTLKMKFKNNSGSPTTPYLVLEWWKPNWFGNGIDLISPESIAAGETKIITFTIPAWEIQAQINTGWNSTSTIERRIRILDVPSAFHIFGSNDPNSYPQGQLTINAYNDYDADAVVKDAYFILENGAPVNSIQIDFPENATSTPDFGNFLLSWTALNPTSTYVGVNYGATSTIWDFYDQSGAGTEIENKNVVFPKMNLLNPRHYFAQANLFEYDENYNKIYLATSTLISFDITAGTYIEFFYPTPTSTATSTEWVFTCDPESGFFANSLCMLARFLFIPKQADFNRFNDLKTALENKPPLGYFYLIKNSLLNFNASTTPAFDLQQSATLSDYIFNPVRNGISFILWLIFGFWVFNRIRKFEL